MSIDTICLKQPKNAAQQVFITENKVYTYNFKRNIELKVGKIRRS